MDIRGLLENEAGAVLTGPKRCTEKEMQEKTGRDGEGDPERPPYGPPPAAPATILEMMTAPAAKAICCLLRANPHHRSFPFLFSLLVNRP
jgi:hypothetical protein